MDTLHRGLTQAKLKNSPRLWAGFAIPGAVWLTVLFVIPFYAVACVAFGGTWLASFKHDLTG